MDIVFNADAMEEIRAASEAALTGQIEAINATIASHEAQAESLDAEAESLDKQAEVQEYIAATAMKAITISNRDGTSTTIMVPDTAARAAAAAAAIELRAQAVERRQEAADLREHAMKLNIEVGKLEQTLAATNAFMRSLIDIVQRTDITNAQMMQMITTQIQAFNANMQAMFDSIDDDLKLSSGNVNINPRTGVATGGAAAKWWMLGGAGAATGVGISAPSWENFRRNAQAVGDALRTGAIVFGTSVGMALEMVFARNSQESLPRTGEPGSTAREYNEDGSLKRERTYGPDGRPIHDRDYNHPDDGTHEFPHDHWWDWEGSPSNPRQPGVPPLEY